MEKDQLYVIRHKIFLGHGRQSLKRKKKTENVYCLLVRYALLGAVMFFFMGCTATAYNVLQCNLNAPIGIRMRIEMKNRSFGRSSFMIDSQ